MSENLHDIDKLFRDGIEEYGEMPSGKVWEGVDAGLDKNNVVQMRRKYNNLKRVAAVLLLLLLSVAGYEIFKPKTGGNGNDVAVGTDKPSIKKEDNSTVLPNNKEGQPNTSNSPAAAQNDNTITNNSNQSNIVSNAGFDSINNNSTAIIPDGKTVAPDKKTVSPVIQQDKKATADKAIASSGTKQKNTSTAVAENDEDKYAVKSSVKRSNQNRTRIKIKSPLPEQSDDATDETADELQAENNSNSSVTELQPLEKTKAAALAERINRAITAAEDVAAKRSSPGVTVKKMKSSRSFHFSLMPFFSPQYASNNIKEESHQQWSNTGQGGPPPPRPGRGDHKEQYKDDEQNQSAYSFGIIAEVPLGKKISVQSGITYLNKSTSIEPKKIYAKTDVDGKVKYVFDCSSGYSYLSTKTGNTPAVGDSITATASKNVLGYIGVPLMVNYKFSLGKFSIMPAVGTVFNFLTKQKIQTQLVQGSAKEQQTVNKIEGLKSNYVNAVTGVAFEYSFNNKIALNIMPSGNFALSSINNSNAVVKSYPNAFAVSGGIKIKF